MREQFGARHRYQTVGKRSDRTARKFLDESGIVKLDLLTIAIVGMFDRQHQRGHTSEAIGAAVTAILGPELAPNARVITAKQGRLIMAVEHPALNHPVRCRLEADLRSPNSQLRTAAISSVTVRVGEPSTLHPQPSTAAESA